MRYLLSPSVLLATVLILSMESLAFSADSRSKTATPVWIDTDPACGYADTYDVDDCWAIVQALNSPELDVRGISTVAGNVDGDVAFTTAKDVVARRAMEAGTSVSVHRGARGNGPAYLSAPNDATVALARLLNREPLTIVALGPLTNVAALLQQHPELAANVREIIAVAGNRPGQRRLFLGDSPVVHFHDLNFRKDPEAFAIVLQTHIPITLVPFEVASQITMQREDLQRIAERGPTARWLSTVSQPWLQFWERWLREKGFYPFDSVAVGYLLNATAFTCEALPARIRSRKSIIMPRDSLEVSPAFVTERTVHYCYGVDASIKEDLLSRAARVLS